MSKESKWTKKVFKRVTDLYADHTYGEISKVLKKEFNLKKTPNAIRKAYKRYTTDMRLLEKNELPNILLFDIETAPIEAYVWSIWDQNVGLNMIKQDWTVLSWSAKWLGKDDIMYEDMRDTKNMRDDTKVLKSIWKLLDEADVVVGHNSDSFDVKKLNARFIQAGMQPPSSYKRMDTKKLAKKHFNFTSNKLQYITDKLCTKYKKLTHGKFPGFSLWKECLANNKEAWNEMKKYNEYDVLSLEEAFLKILPWESASIFEAYKQTDQMVCTCGSIDFVKKGFHYTATNKFQRYRCKNCGSETRESKGLISSKGKNNDQRNTTR